MPVAEARRRHWRKLPDRLGGRPARSSISLPGTTSCTQVRLGHRGLTAGEADKAEAHIDFGSEGVKRLLLRYAPVEKL